mmetsp:Transcript_59496/g.159369  ORF Transcript_59496/g.159369 Transcript_59496/m.159369 type:complete len:246 (+) Transcript_59496:98-835(+)
MHAQEAAEHQPYVCKRCHSQAKVFTGLVKVGRAHLGRREELARVVRDVDLVAREGAPKVHLLTAHSRERVPLLPLLVGGQRQPGKEGPGRLKQVELREASAGCRPRSGAARKRIARDRGEHEAGWAACLGSRPHGTTSRCKRDVARSVQASGRALHRLGVGVDAPIEDHVEHHVAARVGDVQVPFAPPRPRGHDEHALAADGHDEVRAELDLGLAAPPRGARAPSRRWQVAGAAVPPCELRHQRA